MAQDHPLEVPTQGPVRPIVDQEGHQLLQLDIAEDEHPAAQVRYAGSACRWIDHCCEAIAAVL